MIKNVPTNKKSGYNYIQNLLQHLKSDTLNDIFKKDFYWPRQLEIHLPADHKKSCNLHCKWCQGSLYIKDLGNWESDMLCLLNSLKGVIPYHIYGGAYTEPTLNPYLLSCIALTKKYNNYFGIHTNGTMLNTLEQDIGFLTEIDRLATDEEDYISISLDGGLASSWGEEKASKRILFYEILEGIQKLSIKRNNSHKNYSIRLCYLLNEANNSQENIDSIVAFAKHIKVDSLRFSIPYGTYLQPFNKLENYKITIEDKKEKESYLKVQQYLTKETNKNLKPFIFFINPNTTNVTNYNFNNCIYHAYQITAGADGYYYKCSAVAAPNAKKHRLGKITDNLINLKNAIDKNKIDNETWDCKKQCFDKGLRCNRMAIELNQEYNFLIKKEI